MVVYPLRFWSEKSRFQGWTINICRPSKKHTCVSQTRLSLLLNLILTCDNVISVFAVLTINGIFSFKSSLRNEICQKYWNWAIKIVNSKCIDCVWRGCLSVCMSLCVCGRFSRLSSGTVFFPCVGEYGNWDFLSSSQDTGFPMYYLYFEIYKLWAMKLIS